MSGYGTGVPQCFRREGFHHDPEREICSHQSNRPVQTTTILEHPFAYRYYKNPNPAKDVPLVMLAGDFFYLYDYFMPEYNLPRLIMKVTLKNQVPRHAH